MEMWKGFLFFCRPARRHPSVPRNFIQKHVEVGWNFLSSSPPFFCFIDGWIPRFQQPVVDPSYRTPMRFSSRSFRLKPTLSAGPSSVDSLKPGPCPEESFPDEVRLCSVFGRPSSGLEVPLIRFVILFPCLGRGPPLSQCAPWATEVPSAFRGSSLYPSSID